MALLTFADTDATAQRLVNAMTELSKRHADANPRSLTEVASFGELRTETVMLPRDAFLGATEMVPRRQASGRVSAEMICPHPAEIPIVAPAIVDYLQQLAAEGVMVEGGADESLSEFRVVAN
jgi:arginine decarboxylase